MLPQKDQSTYCINIYLTTLKEYLYGETNFTIEIT